MDDDALVAAYHDLLANFDATFAAMKETMQSQADSLVTMQNKLLNIQLCMNVGQQPPSSGYIPAQQQCTFTNHNKCNGGNQGYNRGFPQQPTMIMAVLVVVNSRTFVLPIPTNGGRIGTTVTPMVVMLMAITPVQRVANQVPCTTPTRPAPTSWAVQLLECTRPSCP